MLYDTVGFHYRTLQALGKKQEKYSDVLVRVIQIKVSENIIALVLTNKWMIS